MDKWSWSGHNLTQYESEPRSTNTGIARRAGAANRTNAQYRCCSRVFSKRFTFSTLGARTRSITPHALTSQQHCGTRTQIPRRGVYFRRLKDILGRQTRQGTVYSRGTHQPCTDGPSRYGVAGPGRVGLDRVRRPSRAGEARRAPFGHPDDREGAGAGGGDDGYDRGHRIPEDLGGQFVLRDSGQLCRFRGRWQLGVPATDADVRQTPEERFVLGGTE